MPVILFHPVMAGSANKCQKEIVYVGQMSGRSGLYCPTVTNMSALLKQTHHKNSKLNKEEEDCEHSVTVPLYIVMYYNIGENG